MKIIVCVKQVPDTAEIQWTENNTIKRDNLESIINPFDEYALETALKIKDSRENTKILTISMGPKQAENMLRETLAVGCDESALICDKKFAGADTIATATTISSVIKNKYADFDLIICGQFATDGDTAQTGVGIAEKLKLPQATYVRKVVDVTDDEITVEQECEYGIKTLKLKLPALICVQKCDYELRQPKINGYIYAQNKHIPQIDYSQTGLEEDKVGIKGSPTYVKKAFKPDNAHNVKFVSTLEIANIITKEGVKNE